MSSPVNRLIKSPNSKIYRRVFIKRRDFITGLFESEWQDISNDVKSWGRITSKVEDARLFKLTFGNMKLVMNNVAGKYGPHDDQNSLWFGYLNQQRTLVKYEAGFYDVVDGANGVKIYTEYPDNTLWDDAFWDADNSLWDADNIQTLFTGIISGDIAINDGNEITFNIKPLNSIFEDFAAKNLTGFTSTGITASQFMNMLRDQTDGAGSYVFRPFFGDTTTNWDISTTTNVFGDLNTSTSELIFDQTAWAVVEKLAEAENAAPYVTRDGVFRFISRDAIVTSTAFEFYGAGSFNSEYGHTIKSVKSYGFKTSKFYSRVRIKYRAEDTITSYEVAETNMAVSGSSNPWILGERTLDIDNPYFATSTAAQAAALELFTEVSALKREVDFETSFVVGIDIFDRISISYDPTLVGVQSLWDQNDWADDFVDTDNDLIWDGTAGEQVFLDGQEFKFLSFEIDLDNLQNKFIAREV